MSTPEDIEVALLKRMRDLTFDPANTEVAWPNKKFDPPDAPYVRVSHMRNPNERMFMRGSDPHGHYGILQVTVVSKSLEGLRQAMLLAAQVVLHFPADLKLYEGSTRVKITKEPDVSSPLPTDSSWDLVVSVYYESFA